MAKKSGLGDFGGLEALFDDNSTDIQVKKQVRLSDIQPNRNQPRKEFDEDTIRELAESIEEHGLIQPILVRPLDNGMYQIVAGERRWRALRMLGWQDKEIPVVIKELDDEETAKIALVENVLREDMLKPEALITGANFLVSNTGTIVLTEDEGNILKSMSFSHIHIIVAGIDKLITSMEDLGVLLPLSSSTRYLSSPVSRGPSHSGFALIMSPTLNLLILITSVIFITYIISYLVKFVN